MNRVTPRRLRLLLALAILFSCVGCDQLTKNIAVKTLRDQPSRSYFADTLRLDLAHNPGGFLSLGANLPDALRTTLFVVTNFAMLLGLLIFLVFKRGISLPLFVAIVFVLAGGIGNLIDRMGNNGLVTDFLNLGVGSIRTGVFNVADIAITLGAVAVAFLSIKRDVGEAIGSPGSRVSDDAGG